MATAGRSAAAAGGAGAGAGARGAAGSAAAVAVAVGALSIVHNDMPSELQEHAVKLARDAAATGKVEKDQAMTVKKGMEAAYGGLWHAIVGTAYGLSVSHEASCLVLFRLGKVHYLVFQTFDESSLVRKSPVGGSAGAPRRLDVESKKADDDEDDGGAGAGAGGGGM